MFLTATLMILDSAGITRITDFFLHSGISSEIASMNLSVCSHNGSFKGYWFVDFGGSANS
jgi:hypothetical protein